ncbi:MAG: hypothetical protein V1777_04975 [Candidatus Micrarchaeota archaeon]
MRTNDSEYGGFWKAARQKTRWIDPFTYSDLLLKKINPEDQWFIRFPVELVTALLSAFVLYSIIGFVLQTAMPLVIVVSGSMEPALHRGDVVVLQGVGNSLKAQPVVVPFELADRAFAGFGSTSYFLNAQNRPELFAVKIADQNIRFDKTGDIVVYFSRFNGEPIIHRAVLLIRAKDGDFVLTKGDSVHNLTFDEDCGIVIAGVPQKPCITPFPVPVAQLQGKAVGWIPWIGYIKLILVDDSRELLAGCPNGCRFP